MLAGFPYTLTPFRQLIPSSFITTPKSPLPDGCSYAQPTYFMFTSCIYANDERISRQLLTIICQPPPLILLDITQYQSSGQPRPFSLRRGRLAIVLEYHAAVHPPPMYCESQCNLSWISPSLSLPLVVRTLYT